MGMSVPSAPRASTFVARQTFLGFTPFRLLAPSSMREWVASCESGSAEIGSQRGLCGSLRILTLLLVAGALLAAPRQPVFLAFGAFVAVGGGAIIWNARERESDRRRLREFVLNAFHDSLLEPVAGQTPPSRA
jgi:hypothetical protein